MPEEIKIRVGKRSDVDDIVALQKEIYSQYKRDKPFFEWQCFENVNPSILVVAKQGTSIIGTFGIQKIKTTGGLYGGQLSWLIVDRIQQGKGLFAKMGNLAIMKMSGLDYLFVFANKNAVVPCEKGFDFNFIGSLCQFTLKTDTILQSCEYSLEQIDFYTTFSSLACMKNIVTLLRSDRYRQWRYAKNTSFRYFKVTISSGEYAIIKLFEDKKILGDIVDFECDLLDTERLQSVFSAACFKLRKMGATLVTTWVVPGTSLHCMLNDMGFSESEHCSYFGIKILNKTCQHINDFSNWHIVQSDASNY